MSLGTLDLKTFIQNFIMKTVFIVWAIMHYLKPPSYNNKNIKFIAWVLKYLNFLIKQSGKHFWV